MWKQAAVYPIGRLEEDLRINECIKDGFARDFVDPETPLGLRYRQLQLRSLEEFALDPNHKVLDPPAVCERPRVVVSHDLWCSNSRTYTVYMTVCQVSRSLTVAPVQVGGER
jgi:hypothetical protein